jgi:hypothetical protein
MDKGKKFTLKIAPKVTLLAVVGLLSVSGCSAQEKRTVNSAATGQTTETAPAQVAPIASQELFNGLYADMALEEATAIATEIFQPEKVEQKFPDWLVVYAGNYQVRIDKKSGGLTFKGNFNTSESCRIPYEAETTLVVFSECASSQYKSGTLYFSQGLLFAVDVGFKFNSVEIKNALIKQNGQPEDRRYLSSTHSWFSWQTNSRYIFFNDSETECTFLGKQWFSDILAVFEKQKQDAVKATKERAATIQL